MMSSERMLGAVEAFASFFVPFYFFKAGQGITADELDRYALLFGLLFLIGGVALRLSEVALHRWVALREPPRKSLRIGAALSADSGVHAGDRGLLRDRAEVSPALIGGLVLYTTLVTLLPGLILRLPPMEYDQPHLYPLATDALCGSDAGEPEAPSPPGAPARILL